MSTVLTNIFLFTIFIACLAIAITIPSVLKTAIRIAYRERMDKFLGFMVVEIVAIIFVIFIKL